MRFYTISVNENYYDFSSLRKVRISSTDSKKYPDASDQPRDCELSLAPVNETSTDDQQSNALSSIEGESSDNTHTSMSMSSQQSGGQMYAIDGKMTEGELNSQPLKIRG